MTMRVFLYGLWCLGVAGMFLVSGMYAYSPFAEGARARGGTGAGGIFYGPTHK
jgi:hypothetical protein